MKVIDNLQPDSVEWQADFSASLDENGQWTATQSFKCRASDVLNVIPSRGDDCREDGFEILKFISAQVEEEKGSAWRKVVCNYRGTVYNFDGDEPDVELVPTYNTSVVAQSEPIESHPKFKNITAGQWTDAQWYKDGQIVRNPKDQSKFLRREYDEETNQWKYTEEYTPQGELGALFEAYDKGFTSFYSPRITHSMRYTSNVPISNAQLNEIGKINQPTNAPAVAAGRNWLFMGANMDQSDDVYDVELEWMLSGAEGWDEDFYD